MIIADFRVFFFFFQRFLEPKACEKLKMSVVGLDRYSSTFFSPFSFLQTGAFDCTGSSKKMDEIVTFPKSPPPPARAHDSPPA